MGPIGRRSGSLFFNLKRKRKYELPHRRTDLIIDIILWLLRTGCQWRNLPPDWPHWQVVYCYASPVLL
ncbi:transposase [uncultured Fibrella sp.]|uniref:transposase n=1 Tax=uncultured Fibrella sp. TaxID=1284596 RepID=UPI0035CAFC43